MALLAPRSANPPASRTPSLWSLETAIIADGPDRSGGSAFFGIGGYRWCSYNRRSRWIMAGAPASNFSHEGAWSSLSEAKSVAPLPGRVSARGRRRSPGPGGPPRLRGTGPKGLLVPTPFGPKIARFRQHYELSVNNARKRLNTRRWQDSLWSETRCNLHIHDLGIG
jgi:hypothetical protein